MSDEQLEQVSGGSHAPRKKAGGGGRPRSKGQPNTPQHTADVVSILMLIIRVIP